MATKFIDNSEAVLQKLRENLQALGSAWSEDMVEMVQQKMLYGYDEPHGPDGHTEIVDTGRLFNSIGADAEISSEDKVTVAVGTNVPYATYVHEGTYKLNGRPFLRDALADNAEDLQEVASLLGTGF